MGVRGGAWGRRWGWPGLVGMALLVGCGEVRTTVTTQYREPMVFRGLTFTVAMVDGARAATPWAQAQADRIGTCLEAHGLIRVPAGAEAEALVLFACALDGGVRVPQGRWVQDPGLIQALPDMPPMVARAIRPDPMVGVSPPPPGFMPQDPCTAGRRLTVVTPPAMKYEPRTVMEYTGHFTLAIYRPASTRKEKLFELTAVSKGSSSDLERLARAVFEAALKAFPGERDQPRVIHTRVR